MRAPIKNANRENPAQAGPVKTGLGAREYLFLLVVVVLMAPFMSSCIQHGVVVPEHTITFTFSETDDAFTDTGITRLYHAQVYGDFNNWEKDHLEWHWLRFHDDGVPPDQTKGDKIWTCSWPIPVERYVSYKFYLVGQDSSQDLVKTSIKDPNNAREDDSGNSLLIIQ